MVSPPPSSPPCHPLPPQVGASPQALRWALLCMPLTRTSSHHSAPLLLVCARAGYVRSVPVHVCTDVWISSYRGLWWGRNLVSSITTYSRLGKYTFTKCLMYKWVDEWMSVPTSQQSPVSGPGRAARPPSQDGAAALRGGVTPVTRSPGPGLPPSAKSSHLGERAHTPLPRACLPDATFGVEYKISSHKNPEIEGVTSVFFCLLHTDQYNSRTICQESKGRKTIFPTKQFGPWGLLTMEESWSLRQLFKKQSKTKQNSSVLRTSHARSRACARDLRARDLRAAPRPPLLYLLGQGSVWLGSCEDLSYRGCLRG